MNVDHRLKVSQWLVTVFPPVRLEENAVDLFKINDTGLVADGFDE